MQRSPRQRSSRRPILPWIAVACLATTGARADFQSCLAGLQQQAAAQGVSAQAFRSATDGIAFDDKVIELSQAQPEFKTPIWDYMAALVDDERVDDGKAAMRQHGAAPFRI
ncbi:lytic murein transglycosylase, partial [Methylobacterium sp. WL122]